MCSLSDTYDRGRAQQKNAIDLDFSFDVYYHTRVSDPRCMAVVEVIMLERMLDGVVKGRYSMGWAQLPLFRVSGEQGWRVGHESAHMMLHKQSRLVLLHRACRLGTAALTTHPLDWMLGFDDSHCSMPPCLHQSSGQ